MTPSSESTPEPTDLTSRSMTPLAKFHHWLIAEDKNPTLFAHILIVGLIIGTVALADLLLAKAATQKRYRWMTLYYPPEVTLSESKSPPSMAEIISHSEARIDEALSNFEAAPDIKQRLRSQFLRIQARTLIHSDVMAFFYGRSFVTLVIVSVNGVVGVVCLFFISKDGWSDSNNVLLNLFVVSAGIVVLYSNLSIFLKIEDNVNNNTELYLSYLLLKEEFLSYLVTQKNDTGNDLTPEDFVLYIDQKILQLNIITLDFDNQKVQDYSQQFERVLEGEQDNLADPPTEE
ncbi:MAG: hypothetical protein AAGG51_07895 [Cyanobacteria bacterium P01_G01_bin.54]